MPIFELVFWGGENGIDILKEVELSAFRVTLGWAKIEEAQGSAAENSNKGEAIGDTRKMDPKVEQVVLGKRFDIDV